MNGTLRAEYTRFAKKAWVALLASIVPPLIGPVIVDYYVFNKDRYDPERLSSLPAWNPIAVGAYVIGAASALAANSGWQPVALAWLFPSLLGLLVSIIAYLLGYLLLCRR